MAKPENPGSQRADAGGAADEAPGQGRMHQVRNADGSVVEMTQEEWRNRDKSAGMVRLDGEDEPVGGEDDAE